MFGLALEGEHVTFCLRKQQPLWQLPAGDGGGGCGGREAEGKGRGLFRNRDCCKAREVGLRRQQVAGNEVTLEIRHSVVWQAAAGGRQLCPGRYSIAPSSLQEFTPCIVSLAQTVAATGDKKVECCQGGLASHGNPLISV